MILDTLSRVSLYEACHEGLDEAFAFLRAFEEAPLPVGRHEINGDKVFALVQSYKTQGEHGRMLEAHRRYIDVQYIALGAERIGYCALSDTQEQTAYDEEKECSLHSAENFSWLRMGKGDVAVFFPHDAHMPSISDGEDRDVLKIVVKVLV